MPKHYSHQGAAGITVPKRCSVTWCRCASPHHSAEQAQRLKSAAVSFPIPRSSLHLLGEQIQIYTHFFTNFLQKYLAPKQSSNCYSITFERRRKYCKILFEKGEIHLPQRAKGEAAQGQTIELAST